MLGCCIWMNLWMNMGVETFYVWLESIYMPLHCIYIHHIHCLLLLPNTCRYFWYHYYYYSNNYYIIIFFFAEQNRIRTLEKNMLNSRYSAGEKDNAYDECKLIHDYHLCNNHKQWSPRHEPKNDYKVQTCIKSRILNQKPNDENARLFHQIAIMAVNQILLPLKHHT